MGVTASNQKANMGRETRDRVWDKSKCSNSQLVLLLALAERADASGVCWRAIPT
jgi:hypothetical protein